MEIKPERILSIGDVPQSKGGLYNPGVIKDKDERVVLVRHEKDYLFTNDVKATLFIGTIDELKKNKAEVTILKREGFPPDCRIEDFRLFKYKGELYASHTMVLNWSGDSAGLQTASVQPVISKIHGDKLIFWDYCELPVKKQGIEKNWIFFVYKDELYCIYSLDPLTILKLHNWSWRTLKSEENGMKALVQSWLPKSGHLSLSCVTPWDDSLMLGFWHTYSENLIYQGCFVLNMETLDIDHVTPPVLKGGEWEEGYKPGIVYLSSVIVNDEDIECWVGEADSHTSLIRLPKKDVTQHIIDYPFKKKTPKNILLRDLGLGDYICAMYAVQGWLDENEGSEVNLHMPKHFEIANVLKIPRVKIKFYSGQKCDIDLSSNLGDMYHEKLKHPYKEWYSWKLGVSPKKPDVSHIREHPAYKDYIVLAPFSLWENRTWDIKYWQLLSEYLVQLGYNVVVEDFVEGGKRSEGIKGEKFVYKSVAETFRLVKSAKCVISNDSGMAHIAGLLDTPCLVISGFCNPASVYSCTNVDYIWHKPTRLSADISKRALNSITVDEVMNKLREMQIIK